MNTHARLAPSNHRWPHCAGSVREEERYPDIASEAGIDGTGSHLLLEYSLMHNVPASAYIGQIIGANHPDNINGWLVNEDRAARVQECLDYIVRRTTELRAEYPGCDITVEPETASNPGGAFGREDWYGTADVTITVASGEVVTFIEVIDYKDGRGFVTVKRDDSEFTYNTQLVSYIFGKLRPHIASGPDLVRPFRKGHIRACRMSIVQPKTNPSVRYEDCSVDEIISTVEKMATAARLTDDPDAPLTPGSHCEWCKANPKRGGHCSAQAAENIEVFDQMTKSVSNTESTGLSALLENFADIEKLDAVTLAQLADTEAGIVAMFTRVRDEIESRLKRGATIPGYEMVPGNGRYIWNADEEVIVKALRGRRLTGEQIRPSKLISPAQVEKLDCLTDTQKKKIRAEFVTYVEGKPALKKVSYKRKQKEAKVLFADVPEKQTPSFL